MDMGMARWSPVWAAEARSPAYETGRLMGTPMSPAGSRGDPATLRPTSPTPLGPLPWSILATLSAPLLSADLSPVVPPAKSLLGTKTLYTRSYSQLAASCMIHTRAHNTNLLLYKTCPSLPSIVCPWSCSTSRSIPHLSFPYLLRPIILYDKKKKKK
jgi:hypothetical protein